jgi:antitoxin (DNA-binding transcriptional repressor) of toxin-antitoxin stability system
VDRLAGVLHERAARERGEVEPVEGRQRRRLHLAKAGESVEITERGVPIGRIVPTGAPVENRVKAMVRTG